MAFLTMHTWGRRCRPALCRRVAWLLLGLALLLIAAPRAAAQATPSAEYQLKAACLYKLSQFVEWPARAFRGPAAPLVIGVLGQDPFGAYLDELVRGEKIGDRALMVRRYQHPEDVADCHILFVSRSEAGALETILARLAGRSVLTVSDVDAFAQAGGMVRFVMEGGKIRLRINVEAAKACDLTISSKILRLATIVTAGKN